MDANLNGDAAADRVVINQSGDRSLSSDVTALTSLRNGVNQTVAYVVNNPNAYYVRARPGEARSHGSRAPQADRTSCACTECLAVHAQRVRARFRVSPAGGAGGGAHGRQ